MLFRSTLIVSLGILHTPTQLAVLMAAVVILALQAIAINRLAGLPYPFWASPRATVAPEPKLEER